MSLLTVLTTVSTLDDTNAMLEQIRDWFMSDLGPAVSDIGEKVTDLAGASPVTDYTHLESLLDSLLTSLLNIQGYLLFFVVALLCWAAYKFFKMFF